MRVKKHNILEMWLLYKVNYKRSSNFITRVKLLDRPKEGTTLLECENIKEEVTYTRKRLRDGI